MIAILAAMLVGAAALAGALGLQRQRAARALGQQNPRNLDYRECWGQCREPVVRDGRLQACSEQCVLLLGHPRTGGECKCRAHAGAHRQHGQNFPEA